MKTKNSDKQNLDKAIELLEDIYYKIYIGWTLNHEDLAVSLLPDAYMQKKIATFVKSIKKNTKLKAPKIDQFIYVAA